MKLPEIPTAPLVSLKSAPRVLVRCEHLNPTGSHKDRAYRQMLNGLDTSLGGHELVDYTTGNGGISLSWLAQSVGAQATVFMPEGMTPSRKLLIESYGGTCIETPRDLFLAGARERAFEHVSQNPSSILIDQSDNLANQRAFIDVGHSLYKQLRGSELKPALFVCSIGTGGCLSGIGSVLAGNNTKIKVIGIELPESPLIWRSGEVSR